LLKKSRMPLIAFVTAYDEYAVRAFELNAVDYWSRICTGFLPATGARAAWPLSSW
jgi:hypothetical protein